ncbi:unnamed protein product, partial [Discosporangium mesarthrocarpum]
MGRGREEEGGVKLVQLLVEQNATLEAARSQLKQALEGAHMQGKLSPHKDPVTGKLVTLESMHEKYQDTSQGQAPRTARPGGRWERPWGGPLGGAMPLAQGTHMERECYENLSYGLLERWARAKTTFCSGGGGLGLESSIECYPYKQRHRNKADVFCEARNVFIDFSKVSREHGHHANQKGPRGKKSGSYHNFKHGNIFATCTKTKDFQVDKFMPHQQLQMKGFWDSTPVPSQPYEIISTPTYLLARDEDCENAFHSTADHLNLFMV